MRRGCRCDCIGGHRHTLAASSIRSQRPARTTFKEYVSRRSLTLRSKYPIRAADFKFALSHLWVLGHPLRRQRLYSHFTIMPSQTTINEYMAITSRSDSMKRAWSSFAQRRSSLWLAGGLEPSQKGEGLLNLVFRLILCSLSAYKGL